MNKMTSKIVENTFFNFVAKTVELILTLLLSIIIARHLGPNRFGSYALVMFTFTLAGLLTNLGLSNVGVKYISEFTGDENSEIRTKIIFYVLKIKIISTLIVSGILIILSKYFAIFYSDPQLKMYIILFAVALLPSGISAVCSGVIMGMQKYKYLAYKIILILPVHVIFSFVVLMMGYGIIGLVIINVIISFIEVLYYLILFKTKMRFKLSFPLSLSQSIKKKIFRYNWQVALIIFIDAILWQRSEIFFLSRFHVNSEVAYYSLGYGIVEKVMIFLPSIFAGVLLPVISELYGKKAHSSLQKLYVNSTRYLILFSAPICIGMMAISKSLIFLLYGGDYLPVASVLNILLISGCAGIIASAGASIQYGTEKQNSILKWGSVIALGNITLDFILIPRFGAIGAAIANATAQIGAVVIGTKIVCRLLSVRFPFKDLSKILIAALTIVPIICVIMKLTSGLIGIVLSVIVTCFVYFVMILFLKILNTADKEILNSITNNLPKSTHNLYRKILNFIERWIK
ncbi:MAG: flippase [Candidatus Aminicenantes bacterium]|nr:MAG: flippase [Candidatus Aminicenantes bacterium]